MRSDPECIFCKIVRGEIPSDQVYADERVVAFRDIQPAAPVHVLVAPREHIASLGDLAPDHHDTAAALLMACRIVAEREGAAQAGYRVVTNVGESAGQTVHHLHFHVLAGRQMRALG